nr:hypothetical protein [Tanacetum cinerariifolium]
MRRLVGRLTLRRVAALTRIVRGKENGIYILQSIDHGPFELGTTRDTLGTTPEGGLPKDIYKLINHNIEAKAIWDNVKLLLAGSELTKEDINSQLYDEFERFKMLLGENINEYYVRFDKLINDMRNTMMTMPNIQLSFKLVNNMSPEWDRFVTAVKLNKGLKETNHEQLYAYLKQHEKHAVQDRLIIERITSTTNDQLAFVLSVQPYTQSSPFQSHQYPPSSAPIQSSHVQSLSYPQFAKSSQLDSGYTQADEILETPTKQGAHIRAGNVNAGQGKPIKCFNCNGLGHIADECDAFNSDVDDEPTAQSIFMANLSSSGPTNPQAGSSNASILSEAHDLENAIDLCDDNQDEHEIYNEAKRAQPALYDGNELLKTHHVPVLVTSSEEDLELAKATRIKMNEKIYDHLRILNNLKKIKNDDHDTMVKAFSKIEVAHLNLQLKNQHLKENIENFKSKSSKDVPEFDAFFKLGKRDDQIHAHKNTIRKLKAQISQLKANKSDDTSNLDYKSLDSQNLQLKEIVTSLQERLQNFKAENEKVKLHYQELFNSIKITCVQTVDKKTSLQNEIENLKTQLKGKMSCVTSNDATPKVPAYPKYAIDVQPIPLRQRNNRVVHHGYLNRLMVTLDTLREIVEETRIHILVNPPCPSVSISVDQDAPSEGHSPSFLDHQSPSVHHGVTADHFLEVNPFAPADNEPFVDIFAPDSSFKVSSSRKILIAESNQSTQPHEHL